LITNFRAARRAGRASVAGAETALELRLARLRGRERSVPRRACRCVCQEQHAGARRLRVQELEPGRDRALAEQPLAGAEDDEEDPNPELVDEVVLQQR
jgi:hypothetical protein